MVLYRRRDLRYLTRAVGFWGFDLLVLQASVNRNGLPLQEMIALFWGCLSFARELIFPVWFKCCVGVMGIVFVGEWGMSSALVWHWLCSWVSRSAIQV